MRATYVVPIAVFSALVLFYIKETDALIKCYVCQDCESSYNSSHVMNCTRTQEKCVKMILMSGETDRMCGDKNRCVGRGNGRNKRFIEEVIEDSLPKRRIVRQLLGGGDSGSSSSNKNSNNKNGKSKEKPKEEKKGSKDASSIHCCAEDGCNGGLGFPSTSSPLILISFVVATVFSRFDSQNVH